MPEVRITIRVKPGSSRIRVGGTYGSDGALVVAVNAPPVDGRANDAVCAAVADALDVRTRNVELVSGHTSRTKVLAITCDDDAVDDLRLRLTALLDA